MEEEIDSISTKAGIVILIVGTVAGFLYLWVTGAKL
jgi:hypothetical protein